MLANFDPAVSYVGEARQRCEQGLIEVGRASAPRSIAASNTSTIPARPPAKNHSTNTPAEAVAALPDGARMVAVLQPQVGRMAHRRRRAATRWRNRHGARPSEGPLARARHSDLPEGLHSRICYDPTPTRPGGCKAIDQVLRVITNDLERGTRHTQRSLEALSLMTRTDLRDAVSTLVARRVIDHAPIPGNPQRGAKTFLRPIVAPTDNGAPNA